MVPIFWDAMWNNWVDWLTAQQSPHGSFCWVVYKVYSLLWGVHVLALWVWDCCVLDKSIWCTGVDKGVLVCKVGAWVWLLGGVVVWAVVSGVNCVSASW